MTRGERPARHLSVSATDAEWDVVRDHASRQGLTIARYLVGLVERDGRERDGLAPALALDREEQRELLEGVREIRALLTGGGDAAPLVEDIRMRVAVRFAAWADDMLDAGRDGDLRAAIAEVRGEDVADRDMARLRRDRRRRGGREGRRDA